jgi:hypothetical protein
MGRRLTRSRLPGPTEERRPERSRSRPPPGPRTAEDPFQATRGLGPGHPLPAAERDYFEARLGTDLGGVRLHKGREAAERSRALGALAFAAGRDLVLGAGSRRVLAHELVHVAQGERSGWRNGKALSESGDAAEREADGAAEALLAGRAVAVREAPRAAIARQQAPPLAWGSGWFPSQGGQIPGVTTQAPPPPVPAAWPPIPWQHEAVFEPPEARTAAGAPTAFDAYIALDDAGRRRAFDISYANGNLAAAIRALGPARAQGATYVKAVQQLLRLVEGVEVRAASGQTSDQMAATQAAFLRANPSVAQSGGWGGAAPGKTRWEALTDDQKRDWTRRGTVAIGLMVAHAATAAPELALSAANFELDFEGVDSVSLGAFATVGSQAGRTVRVGFEFTVICQVNPAYALSTVEHELHGHPVFDAAGPNFAGALYEKAAAQVPGSPAGSETYEYYPSEIYSLLREIPYWVATSAADSGRAATLPGGKSQGIGALNPDPRSLIAFHLGQMRAKWAPSLLEPLLRGFWRRVSLDPCITPTALTAFQNILKRMLGDKAAASITR